MYSPIIAGALTLVIGFHAQLINPKSPLDSLNTPVSTDTTKSITVTPKTALKGRVIPIDQKEEVRVQQLLEVTLTAYSSSPEETDDTPNITAMNTETRHGVVATNMLPLGTKVKIPSLYGDEIFRVEDRMHPRMVGKLDIWMPSKEKALKFGSKPAVIVVVE